MVATDLGQEDLPEETEDLEAAVVMEALQEQGEPVHPLRPA